MYNGNLVFYKSGLLIRLTWPARVSRVENQSVMNISLRAVHIPVRVNTALLKRLSHEIFGPVYRPVWMHLGLNKNRFWFLIFLILNKVLRHEAAILSFDTFQFKPSWRFLESPRSIGNWGLSCQSFFENWGLSCQSFSENWGLCCQSFSEILRFSDKYLHPKQHFSENR